MGRNIREGTVTLTKENIDTLYGLIQEAKA